ncbi:thioredoxin domain-containing protein 2 [Microtus ochrogaster]|uniref:Thioredoxin domain-containing protein 2 n=1 Tax=Microtus ochrogaster TaxID=79684 RepID=A0ABM1UJ84_MICOH|nr:thioredoxin domain-containing protein 2 [Microtus ochrogaster]
MTASTEATMKLSTATIGKKNLRKTSPSRPCKRMNQDKKLDKSSVQARTPGGSSVKLGNQGRTGENDTNENPLQVLSQNEALLVPGFLDTARAREKAIVPKVSNTPHVFTEESEISQQVSDTPKFSESTIHPTRGVSPKPSAKTTQMKEGNTSKPSAKANNPKQKNVSQTSGHSMQTKQSNMTKSLAKPTQPKQGTTLKPEASSSHYKEASMPKSSEDNIQSKEGNIPKSSQDTILSKDGKIHKPLKDSISPKERDIPKSSQDTIISKDGRRDALGLPKAVSAAPPTRLQRTAVSFPAPGSPRGGPARSEHAGSQGTRHFLTRFRSEFHLERRSLLSARQRRGAGSRSPAGGARRRRSSAFLARLGPEGGAGARAPGRGGAHVGTSGRSRGERRIAVRVAAAAGVGLSQL